jgi:hypothetical protein
MCHIGLVVVDEIREEFNLPKFPLSSINNHTSCSARYSILIDIDEDVARRSGHFKEATVVDVNVPKLFLTPYQKLEFIPVKEFPEFHIFGFGAFPKFWRHRIIKSVGIHNCQICEDIIKDWEASGHPLQWNTENYKGKYNE